MAPRQPVIFPVNYALDGQFIVFRNDPGTKLTHASFGRVAFEVPLELRWQTTRRPLSERKGH